MEGGSGTTKEHVATGLFSDKVTFWFFYPEEVLAQHCVTKSVHIQAT